jgi:adenosine deaminase
LALTSLPKAHLHLHLEAAIRPATILDLYRHRGGKYAGLTIDEVIHRVRMGTDETSFGDFLGKFQFIVGCQEQPADLIRVTREAIADAEADGVCYVELRFCPHSLEPRCGIAALSAIEAVSEGVRAGMADCPRVTATITVIIDQRRGPAVAREAVRWAARHRAGGVTAIDIAGDPTVYPLGDYAPACALARDEGLGLTVHAGELQGPETVRVAVEVLGTTRIGHGIRSVEDPAVLDLLLARGVTLEVCVTSNVHMRAAASLESHPLPRLMDAGVRVTINSDDPLVFNTTLTHEYELVQDAFGVTLADFRRMNLHAVDAAFVDDTQRQLLRSAIEQGYAHIGAMG